MKFQNNETATMLVFQTNPVGLDSFLIQTIFLFSQICIDAGQVSENHLLQSEAIKCEAIDMKATFYFHVTKTHFHKKGFALSPVLKARVLGT